MDLEVALRTRRSVRAYDPEFVVTDEHLGRLFDLVVLSPSSFNLQHGRFVVVREAGRKARLQEAAYGQKQVGSASAVVVVCGKLTAHRDAPRAFADVPPEARAGLVAKVERFYEGDAALRRDEAIRSTSLAAMTLLLAAHSLGLATTPMSGFDPRTVADVVGLDEDHVPVMLVTLGKAASPSTGSGSRFPVAEVVRLERLDGPGLSGGAAGAG